MDLRQQGLSGLMFVNSNIHLAVNVSIFWVNIWTKKHLSDSLGRVNQKHNLILLPEKS